MNQEMEQFNPEEAIEPEETRDLDEEVAALLIERRSRAEELIEQGLNVSKIISQTDNNYSLLEEKYSQNVGNSLLSNPEHPPEKEITITKTCSIVIPAYNNFIRLKTCLNAIIESSFFKKYPQLLEVVVVDDGSSDEDIAEGIRGLSLPDLNIKVFKQSNGRVGKARYSGVLNSTGEVVLVTDPDIVYTPKTIEEFMKRHQILEGVTFFGFRDEIDNSDDRLTSENIASGSLSSLPVDINADPRVMNNVMEKCDWLKEGGNDVVLPIDEDDERYDWRLRSMAWGFSLSADREDLLRILCGYDERYLGYGGEDEDMVARLIALGNYVIPMTGGFCYHQRHSSGNADESKHQINISVLKSNILSPLKEQDIDSPKQTDAELVYGALN